MSSFSNINTTNNNVTSNPTSCSASDTSSLFSFKGTNSALKPKSSKKHWFSRSSSSSVSSKSKGDSSLPALRSTEKTALHNEAIATYMSYRYLYTT
ncbi:hypothetical protein BDW42DRAFT_195263 [Aspergillus taichungensis]|uniref:Uncharacterized protein n=1 Tax=Aspergillus taichungensis TaxID=482145 RepID=A0A2J5HQ44_9EURO|nr:hypothetical protein BDW42DRAFT_195263 [Aspergillus taichungensis]